MVEKKIDWSVAITMRVIFFSCITFEEVVQTTGKDGFKSNIIVLFLFQIHTFFQTII